MTNELQPLMNRYFAWLKDKTSLRQLDDGWTEITTPYLDRHNDYIQIYIRRQNGGFQLTDDGFTIRDLEQSGCKLDTPKREQLLRATLAGFGVHNQKGILELNTSTQTFPMHKHNLIQAILAVNDLFYVAVPLVASLFYEDVTNWLDLSGVRYTPDVTFTGKTGFNHHFQFVIPKSQAHPERIVEAITRPTKAEAENFIFRWEDTKETRQPNAKAYAILNDQGQRVSQLVVDALANYDVRAVPWAEREAVKEELAA